MGARGQRGLGVLYLGLALTYAIQAALNAGQLEGFVWLASAALSAAAGGMLLAASREA